MKEVWKYLPNVAAIIASALLAASGFEGWYWFLVVAVLV